MIETVVVATLETIPALKGKVYPLFVPEKETLPFCVYVSDGAEEADTLSGWSNSFDTEMEIHVVHRTYAEMKSLAAAVDEKLKAMEGVTVYIEQHQPENYEPEIQAYHRVIRIKLTY